MSGMNSQKGFAHLILLFILFVALAAGYLYFTRSTNFFNNLSTSVIQPLKSAKLGLTLNNLSDGAVVEGGVITIEGKTLPNTIVAIYSDTDQNSTESDANGKFMGKITLEPG